MSMHVLTVFQISYITILYLLVIIGVPAIAFGRFFKKYPFAVRFMAYLAIGNFYVINVVYALQILHICNRYTLALGFIIPMLVATARLNWKYWFRESLMSAGEATHNVMVSTMGVRLLITRVFGLLGKALATLFRCAAKSIRENWVDWIGSITVAALVLWQYGTNALTQFGYMASDSPVHNYWINEMSNHDNIFASGVYPFGFHCTLYFFHEIFGIEVFVMLRLYTILQTMLIHMMLLCFLRTLCKLPMLSYVALILYTIAAVWGDNAYIRYFYTLPQEYGMIYILPSICFLILFFREREAENGEKGFQNESTKMISLFAISFSLTLAVHFYDTIIAGLFCLAIAVGFLTKVFRKAYLGRILGFGMLSIFMAILPLAIALGMGKPLEGSLRWGISVMKGLASNTEIETTIEIPGAEQKDAMTPNLLPTAYKPISVVALSENSRNQIALATADVAGNNFGTKLTDIIKTIKAYIFPYTGEWLTVLTLILVPVLLLLGILIFFLCDRSYAGVLISSAIYTGLLCVIMAADKVGFPRLMDESRCSMYLGYAIPILYALTADAVLYLILRKFESEAANKLIPVAMMLIVVILLIKDDMVKKPAIQPAFETNGAIVCVTNILRENKPQTFTIVSASDELRMVEKYGYHYEINDLLTKCVGNAAYDYEAIPTPKIYVFVEKKPVDYGPPYAGSGSMISLEDAKRNLPVKAGITMYQGEARRIVMSKMYYWAKTLKEMYPNETSVYYEDDEFICYEISQNVYWPLDMTFEYGYNN